MKLKQILTTLIEIVGGMCIVAGISSFSIPIGVIVLGVLLVIGGGLAA